MEGDNVYVRPDGTGRSCNICRLAAVKRHQTNNHEAYLKTRSENRSKAKSASDEAAWSRILAIYAEDLDDDELIRRLREAMPPVASPN